MEIINILIFTKMKFIGKKFFFKFLIYVILICFNNRPCIAFKLNKNSLDGRNLRLTDLNVLELLDLTSEIVTKCDLSSNKLIKSDGIKSLPYLLNLQFRFII